MAGKKTKKKKGEPSLQAWAVKRIILAVVLVVVIFFGVKSCFRFVMGWDSELHSKYKSVKMGAMESFVEEVMGDPVRVTNFEIESFPAINYEEIKERSEKSGAVKFYYYENGINTLYILGFDRAHMLVFKEQVKA